MKTWLLYSILFAAVPLVASAQQSGPPINTNATWRASQSAFVFKPDSINEIKRGRITYGGLAVDVIKEKKNPLQIINPYAPGNNTGKDNAARDLSGKPVGWNFLTL